MIYVIPLIIALVLITANDKKKTSVIMNFFYRWGRGWNEK